jgi:predicted house-cleaning noncanonical NTP pyrophosphatase (MazG superfamily)
MGWKMVRDNHRELLEGKISGQWRTSPDPVGALLQKLGEEYGEFCASRDPQELYDLRDVLAELIVLLATVQDVERWQQKVQRGGLFTAHLEWTAVPWEEETDTSAGEYIF